MKKYLFIFSILFSTLLFSQDRFEKIDNYLNLLNENNKFMGSLTIREGENVVFNKAYGFADVDQNIKANRLTKYKIGSITKTFTAVMIMQLIEEKKLRMETKLHKFFPKVAKSDSISIYDLLYQRSGIPDYINHDTLTLEEENAADIKSAIYSKIENYKSRFTPGSKFEYSNSNYYLLGGILEKITKKTYQENLNERIVQKAGLGSYNEKLEMADKGAVKKQVFEPTTYYKTESTALNNKESYSYTFNGEKWQQFPEWKNETAFSAGGIISTSADLTRFYFNLFEGKLVSKKTLSQMTELKEGYGAALIQMPFGERNFYGHSGAIENFKSVVGYYPTEQTGIALNMNGDNYNQNDIMIGILSIYYKLPFPMPTFKSITPELITKYSGTYSSKDIPLKLTIFEKNGDLMAQATGQGAFPLTIQDDKTFVFPAAGIEINFDTDSLLLKQGGMKFNFVKEK
jgi:CubicO group peptidase (beta-lactamase class C family)